MPRVAAEGEDPLAKRYGLLKQTFDFESLIHRRFLDRALEAQKLEG